MLIINLDNFSLDSKNEIYDENEKLKYWSQYDFSYKHRVHIYDADDNEIGYVQYRILSTQESAKVFSKEDKEIDLSNISNSEFKDKWNYSIVNDGNVIASVRSDGDKAIIDIMNEQLFNECILYIFSLAE